MPDPIDEYPVTPLETAMANASNETKAHEALRSQHEATMSHAALIFGQLHVQYQRVVAANAEVDRLAKEIEAANARANQQPA